VLIVFVGFNRNWISSTYFNKTTQTVKFHEDPFRLSRVVTREHREKDTLSVKGAFCKSFYSKPARKERQE
jgi:hypothetical protein